MENISEDSVVELKPTGIKARIASYFGRHTSCFETLWNISLFIGFIYGIVRWLWQIFQAIQQGNFIGFVFAIILQTIIIGLTAILVAIFVFIVLLAITIIPYLIIRGLVK